MREWTLGDKDTVLLALCPCLVHDRYQGKKQNTTLGLRTKYMALSFHSATSEMRLPDPSVWEEDFILNSLSLLRTK